MSYVKNYEVGITRLDATYKNIVHELPLLSFGDTRNTFALSLIFQSKLTSNPFYIANGYKLNIQKRIVFSSGYPQSYEDGDGTLVKLNRFGNKYAFDDGSQRIIRLINGQYVLENPDYSTEIFNTNGNILSSKDKYGNTILSYTYSSSKLTSVVYKGYKTVNFSYSGSAMQYIQYTYSGSTFKTTFTYSGNKVIIKHYSGVDYHSTYASNTFTIYSANSGAAFSNTYSHKSVATKNNEVILIKKYLGNKEIDEISACILDCDTDGNVRVLDISDFHGVSTRIQIINNKPAYSYELFYDMFKANPQTGNYYYPGKVTFHNNYASVGSLGHADGRVMSCTNSSTAIERNSYVLLHNFSGMMTVSGWVKPVRDAKECTISISGSNQELVTHLVTGLQPDDWTFFSVTFRQENDDCIHARTNETNIVIETRDFRLSGQLNPQNVPDEYKDNLVRSDDVLVHTDGNGNNYNIPLTKAVYFNGSTNLNNAGYDIKAKDLMRFKINQELGTNKGEIYYDDGRGILSLENDFYVRYKAPDNTEKSVSLTDLAIGKIYSSKTNEVVTKTNFYTEGGVKRLKTQSLKQLTEISSEIYNENLDLVKSTLGKVTTTYARKAATGLVQTKTIKDTDNTSVITSSATYDANDFVLSTTDEFGVVTTYVTDIIWGVIKKSTVTNGLIVTDTFDDDCSTQVSRNFGNTSNKKHEFTYSNGHLSTIKNDTLTYTMGYNQDILSSIQKNGLLIGEFDDADNEYNIYDGKSTNEYYPNSTNPTYTITQMCDKYGRVAEIEGLIKNTYDIAPVYTNGSYTKLNIKNSSAKLAVSKDFKTGNETKYAYKNDNLDKIGEFNSSGTKVNEESFTYDNKGNLTVDTFTDSTTSNTVQHNITYFTEQDSHMADGMVATYSYKVNGTEKAKTENTCDNYKRVTNKKYTVGGKVFAKGIEYDKTRVKKIVDSVGTTTSYEYDSMGRISKEKDGGGNILKSYIYDSYGQLTQENNKSLDKTFVYEYNNIGNVASVKTYNYTTGTLGAVISQQNFGYDATCPDRLTSCGGTSISYDSIGCPTTYNGYSASWTRGKLSRLLKGVVATGMHNYYYNYNAFGQRTSIHYSYLQASSSAVAMGTLTAYSQTFRYDKSGRLIYESKASQYQGEGVSDEKKIYLYDETGIIGMVYTASGATNTYYFQRNLLGDVIGIYNTSGAKVGGYAYDAWGNCTITLNTNGIANKNPIRYRGYYYDEDTKLYYLNARYYCPEWRRFISPDDTAYLDPKSVNGLNLYTYCNNDPVNYVDPSGHSITLALIFAGTFAVGFGSSLFINAATNNWQLDWRDFAQAGIDGLFAVAGTALAMTGICAGVSIGLGAAMGWSQYAIGTKIQGGDLTWSGSITAIAFGALGGIISGPGATNVQNVADNLIGLSDDGLRAAKAIATAMNRRMAGQISKRGLQGVLNLYGKTAFSAIDAAIPGTSRMLFMVAAKKLAFYTPFANIASGGLNYLYNVWGWI